MNEVRRNDDQSEWQRLYSKNGTQIFMMISICALLPINPNYPINQGSIAAALALVAFLSPICWRHIA
jgi:hypothetical protein